MVDAPTGSGVGRGREFTKPDRIGEPFIFVGLASGAYAESPVTDSLYLTVLKILYQV